MVDRLTAVDMKGAASYDGMEGSRSEPREHQVLPERCCAVPVEPFLVEGCRRTWDQKIDTD